MTATVGLVPAAADAPAERPLAATPATAGATARPESGARSGAEEETAAGAIGRLRPVLLLLLFIVGCTLAAAGAALAVAMVWQEVYAWAVPHVVGDMLVG